MGQVKVNTIPFTNIKIQTFLRLLRVKQWTKNFLLFAGLIFAEQIFIWSQLKRVCAAFAAFCLLSSSLYIINDLVDLERDKNHHRKKFRPIASGEVFIQEAVILAILLGSVSFLISVGLGMKFIISYLVYAVITIAYTFLFKNLALIDVTVIAFGFVIRAVAGAVVISVPISSWFLLCVMLLALFLALVKGGKKSTIMQI